MSLQGNNCIIIGNEAVSAPVSTPASPPSEDILSSLKDSIREELRSTIRKEIEAEMRHEIETEMRKEMRQEIEAEMRKEMRQEIEAKPTMYNDAFWSIHELQTIITVPIGDKDSDKSENVKVFDQIPGLLARSTKSKQWVGLKFPTDAPPSLHGDLSFIVTLHRKDGTTVTSSGTYGKFNYGRFFVNNDELTTSWGPTFKKDDFETLSFITMHVLFKRNHDEKRTAWQIIDKFTDDK